MFSKILIANRGEIAVRIIRAAREMGVSTVAVFSECDRAALHVRMADEAYLLGPSPSTESYLNVSKIVQLAEMSQADAIHPGYGFLAENPELPRHCASSGISFIGPTAAAMKAMGEKISARRTALRAGVPIVPGTEAPISGKREALKISKQIGFPILLKASAGGGGKGMRLVYREEELSSALRDTQSEAGAAFGDSAIYIEKYLPSPRHIEFQVLADHYGNTVHLGERECSIQRRHQKVIEECPSPFMTSGLRMRMGEAAVKLAKACAYVNAGTVEFLVDSDGNFYFLEMNTRLQVEHPITELVTAIDLVKEQIRIASGEALAFKQEDISWRGCAIECRIYAEDPDNNFFPSPGKIKGLKIPGGPGIRDDSGIYEGWTVPIHYDPLLSKLVAWGNDRHEAIQRMRRALQEYQVIGIKTTIPFFQSILLHPRFIAGELSIDFIDRYCAQQKVDRGTSFEQDVALIAAALYAGKRSQQKISQTSNSESAWKQAGRLSAMRKK